MKRSSLSTSTPAEVPVPRLSTWATLFPSFSQGTSSRLSTCPSWSKSQTMRSTFTSQRWSLKDQRELFKWVLTISKTSLRLDLTPPRHSFSQTSNTSNIFTPTLSKCKNTLISTKSKVFSASTSQTMSASLRSHPFKPPPHSAILSHTSSAPEKVFSVWSLQRSTRILTSEWQEMWLRSLSTQNPLQFTAPSSPPYKVKSQRCPHQTLPPQSLWLTLPTTSKRKLTSMLSLEDSPHLKNKKKRVRT